MLKDLNISEFEAAITMRTLLSSRMWDKRRRFFRTEYTYEDALVGTMYAANEILKDLDISQDLWCMARGQRLYMLHKPTRRIACEIGVVTDGRGPFKKRLRAVILDRKGYTKARTVGELAINADRLSKRRFSPKPHDNHLAIENVKGAKYGKDY